jgi:hypothetical protein
MTSSDAAVEPPPPMLPPEPWLTPWRVRVYPRAVLFAVAVGWAVVLGMSLDGFTPQGVPLGGDWMVFHAAGDQILAGTPERLVDAAAMQQAQAAALSRDALPGYHAWIYPAYVAPLLAPFAALPFVGSYLAFTLAMAAATAGAAVALARTLPNLAAGTVAAAALGFYPLTRAVTGGQNTALTLLLASVALLLLHRRRDGAAGVVLGLMAFKPHIGLAMLALVVLAGRWRVLPSAAAVGAAWFALGVAVLGLDWPARWLASVAGYHALEAEVNGHQLVSLLAVAERIWGVGSPAAQVVGGGASAALALALVATFVRRGDHLPACFGAALAVLPLALPHVQYYDLGLLVLPAAVLASAGRHPRTLASLWAAGWVLAPLQGVVPVQPLLALALAGAGLALDHAWRSR